MPTVIFRAKNAHAPTRPPLALLALVLSAVLTLVVLPQLASAQGGGSEGSENGGQAEGGSGDGGDSEGGTGADTPDTEVPAGTPDTSSPDTDAPDTSSSDPGSDTPGTDSPETDAPDDGSGASDGDAGGDTSDGDASGGDAEGEAGTDGDAADGGNESDAEGEAGAGAESEGTGGDSSGEGSPGGAEGGADGGENDDGDAGERGDGGDEIAERGRDDPFVNPTSTEAVALSMALLSERLKASGIDPQSLGFDDIVSVSLTGFDPNRPETRFVVECACPARASSTICSATGARNRCARRGREIDDDSSFFRAMMLPTRSVAQQMQELEILSGTPGANGALRSFDEFTALEVRQILIGSVSSMMLNESNRTRGTRLQSH